jgi:nucleotide-binding universal stress UspA family protein
MSVDGDVSSPDELEEQMTEIRRRHLEALVAGLHAGFDIQTNVLIGMPHEEITREVISNGHDLVLKAQEGGNGLKERLFGDKDSRLLNTCPCPVLLVKSLPPKPYRHRRICAGVYQDEHPGGHRDDRYAINRRILENATWFATAQFAQLHIIHAWDAYGEQHLRSGRSPLQSDADDYVESELQRNKQALDTCLTELRESIAIELLPAFNPVCHLVRGSHRDEIVRLAVNMEADLVVVGDLVHSGLTGLIVDSTAEAITRHLNCSILVVKPPEFVTPVVVEEM